MRTIRYLKPNVSTILKVVYIHPVILGIPSFSNPKVDQTSRPDVKPTFSSSVNCLMRSSTSLRLCVSSAILTCLKYECEIEKWFLILEIWRAVIGSFEVDLAKSEGILPSWVFTTTECVCDFDQCVKQFYRCGMCDH